MEQLKKIFCRYDIVCNNPSGAGFEIYSLTEYFEKRHGLETDNPHMHGFFEIIWFQEGEGVHLVDFNEYPVFPGTVFFISPGQIHSFDKSHNQEGIVMKICADLLNDLNLGESTYIRYNVFNAFDQLPFIKISDNDTMSLLAITEAMKAELNEVGSLGHKDYLSHLISLFILRVQRNNIQTNTQTLNPVKVSNKTFLSFRRLLEENYRKVHTVKEYATMLHVTSKTLTQYTNECSSYSPLEIINNRIALEARRLLRYSTLSVKEIAFYLGFDDPSYFVKFFKRMIGQSPADYREELV